VLPPQREQRSIRLHRQPSPWLNDEQLTVEELENFQSGSRPLTQSPTTRHARGS